MGNGFWAGICGGEELFNKTSALNSSTPHLSACVEHTLLIWPAALFLFWGTIFQVYRLSFTPARGRLKWTALIVLRLLVNFILFCIASANLGIQIARIVYNDETDFASNLATVLLWLIMLDLLILTEANRRRGRRSSGVLWLSWFILTVSGILQFSQKVERVSSGESNPSNGVAYHQDILFLCYFPLVISMLILHSFADVYKYETISEDKECPESGSSFLCKITFSWFIRTALLGYKRSLTRDDLWKLREKDQAETIIPQWSKNWDRAVEEQRRKALPPEPPKTSIKLTVFDDKAANGDSIPNGHATDYQSVKHQECPSLVLNLLKTVKWQFIPAVMCKLSSDLLSFVSPQILKILIAFIDTPSMPLWIGLLFACLMFFSSTVQSVLQNNAMYRMFNMAMNVRSALTATVYNKALRLSTTARRDATVGEMVNYMAVDVQRMSDVTQWVQQLWATPIMISISLYCLYGELGYSALVGFCVMLVLMPCNFLLSRYQKLKQVRMMKFKDRRMKLMNEILNGMKVLKLYAWEEPFEKKVVEVRDQELNTLKRGSYFDATNAFTLNCAPFMVAVASFATFVLSSPDHILTPQKAFVSLSLFNILRQPLNQLPNVVSAMVQASVSNKRLKNFLSQPELNPDLVVKNGKQEETILVQNGTFVWNDAEEQTTLNDINLAVKPGQLVAIVGPVGCGKSSLLSAILGDMEPRGGVVHVNGSVAYVPQQAWIQSLTLQNNIIFTKQYSESLYNKVVDACALRPDFEILPSGDTTEIGEKGINLSGGQKQRVSLARAVYQDRDVYLLDDPLSAVDAHVGRHIFDKVIGKQGMLKDKTRVLVTHGLAYLKDMDNIFVMKEGRVSQSGTLAELLHKGGPFAEFLETYLTQRSHDLSADPDEDVFVNEIVEELQKVDPTMVQRLRSCSVTSSQGASRKNSQTSLASKADLKVDINKDEKPANGKFRPGGIAQSRQRQKLGQNIKHEKVQKGKVQWRIYKDYITAVGYFSFLAIFMAFIASSSLGIGMNLWLSAWSGDSAKPLNETMNVDIRLVVYASLGCGQAFFVFCAAFICVRVMVLASGKMHQRLLHNLMRTPMSFYDVTPLGAIISRVGKDVDIMDGSLPGNFRQWILQSLNVLSSVVVIMISTPYVGIAVLPLGLFYYFLQRFYVSTSRQLRRLESASRAPIYSHFGETLTGVTSIRAYGVEKQFIDEANFRVDENMKVVYAQIVANRWLSIFLQFIGNCLIMFAALFAVLGRNSGIDTGLAALSITYAMTITNTLQMSVRLSSDLEANIVAVERIKEYAELKNEAPWVTDIRPPAGWPAAGVVDFEKLELRYREGQDLVLRGVDWHVDGREKAGVVGRTGAGKSSMTLALFRIVEAAGGRIVIDGVDISKIGLHDLRSRLAIIPQDPILFSGTLRINLDPFDDHHDSEVWAALEQAHLKPFVSQLADGLQYRVTEGGENLSVGQRQLLCLARALLRRSRILVLDEATAAVDLETESLILETIRSRFSDCTIITIAHRLNTIMDSDKILIMSQGRALEHGSPEDLLANPNSAFFAMAKDAGLIAVQELKL